MMINFANLFKLVMQGVRVTLAQSSLTRTVTDFGPAAAAAVPPAPRRRPARSVTGCPVLVTDLVLAAMHIEMTSESIIGHDQ